MLPAAESAIVPRRIPLDLPSELGCGSDEEGTSRMRFHADLHVHSKYSRATSRDCDLEHLAAWAGRKGIGVVGTGDFTHPAWCAELKEKLVPAEPGLFRLRDDIERRPSAQTLPAACRTAVRFMLEVEISTIYKKGDRTRKIHHLIYVPDFEAVDRMSARLARIGNIASDGRPILGLDSRDLLEIALEVRPGRLSRAGAHLDAVVRGARLAVRLRLHRRLLRRPRRPHLRGRDRALVRPADELAGLVARPLPPGLQLRRALARQARARGVASSTASSTTSPSAARWRPATAMPARSSSFPRRASTTSTATASARCASTPEGNAAARRALPGLRQAVTIGVEHRVEMLADRASGGGAAADRRRGHEPGAAAGDPRRDHRQRPGDADGRRAATTGASASARPRARDPAGGAGRGHRPRRLVAAGGGDHAAARRRGDPRGRLRRRIRRHPPVRGERAASG